MTTLGSWPVSAGPGRFELERSPGPRHLDSALLARWRDALAAWKAPPEARAALDRLARAETLVVVTGQQPGPWGGPLFTAYKAATAVGLAQRLARATGRPAVAVFWVQADDTDWDEVGWGSLPFPGLDLLRHRWAAPGEARQWVGGAALRAPEELASLLEAWGGRPGAFPGPAGSEAEELAGSFTRGLLGAFGDKGLLPLDSRWPEIRRAGEPLWPRYHQAHGDLARDIARAGERLEASGGRAPLGPADSDHGLFVLDGERRRPVLPETWAQEVGACLAAGEFERLAPSVLLRAPLQDHLLAPSAHVVGETEGAYLRQLDPVYDALGIHAPARVPRLGATLLPRGLVPVSALGACVEDPEAWMTAQVLDHVPAATAEGLNALRRDHETGFESLLAASGDAGQDLVEVVEAARRKIEVQLQRVEETLDRRARQSLYRASPRLRHLPEFLRPRRRAQERGLSAASLFLLVGERAPELLLDTVTQHLDRLEEGTHHHFVLEAEHD